MSAASPRVAVVGAGLSGSTCAHLLAAKGFHVTVFDKARGPGGRIATRRVDTHAFDHGAQYFTVRESRFKSFVDGWIRVGAADRWSGPLAVVRDGVARPLPAEERFVGSPGMSAITRELLNGIESRFEKTVKRVRSENESWYLSLADSADAGPFDITIVATPPAQAVAMAGRETRLLENATERIMSPCWATVLAFPSRLDFAFDGAFVDDSLLSWIARDSSKPGRPKRQEVWVLHASREWSKSHLERSHEFVSRAMQDAFDAVVGPLGQSPDHLLTHRWRYAQPELSGGVGSLYDSGASIGFCGDWLTDGRVESAVMSGIDMAERVSPGGKS